MGTPRCSQSWINCVAFNAEGERRTPLFPICTGEKNEGGVSRCDEGWAYREEEEKKKNVRFRPGARGCERSQ